jgi:Flp pilus assembly pilin Flp
MKKIWNFIKDEEGLETPEYAVMGALIIVGLVIAVGLLRDQIIDTFGKMQDAVTAP